MQKGKLFVRINEVKAVFTDNSPVMNGYEVLNRYFDELFSTQIEWFDPSGKRLGFRTNTQLGIQRFKVEADAGAIALDTWGHIAVTFDANIEVFLNGASQLQMPGPGPLLTSSNPLYMGADCNNGAGCPDDDFVDGNLDEIRIESGVRSAGWIAYEHASMIDQVISFGPIER
jgi:hypothetical protein